MTVTTDFSCFGGASGQAAWAISIGALSLAVKMIGRLCPVTLYGNGPVKPSKKAAVDEWLL